MAKIKTSNRAKPLSEKEKERLFLRIFQFKLKKDHEPFCDWYGRWMKPELTFLFIRKFKRGRYPKHEDTVMKGGGANYKYFKENGIEMQHIYFHGLWCAN